MAAPRKPAADTSRAARTANLRRWLLRGGIAALVGAVVGGIGGVLTVNTVEPGRPDAVDSLQTMIDSIAIGKLPGAEQVEVAKIEEELRVSSAAIRDSLEKVRLADSLDAVRARLEIVDATMVTVPSIIGMEEGLARDVLLDAALQVGEVRFRASLQPAGKVLATIPAPGARLTADAAVILILSDGRRPTDSLPIPVPSSRP